MRKLRILVLVLALVVTLMVGVIGVVASSSTLAVKYDIVIKNGRVMDPVTSTDKIANIGIKDGLIAEITTEELDGEKIIDASGRVVAPGFIDIHSHADGQHVAALCKLRQGITSELGGNCGGSPWPIGEFYDEVDKGFVNNQGILLGHETLREMVGLKDRYTPANKQQIAKMVELAEKGMQEGAMGISFGLEYLPGASTGEVLKLSEIAAKYGGMVTSHIRYGDPDPPGTSPEGVEEIAQIGLVTGASIEISHIGSMGANKMEECLEVIEKYRKLGVDIMADIYPWEAWSTGLCSAVFDLGWQERFRMTYHDIELVETGERLTEETFNKYYNACTQGESTSIIAHQIPPEDVIKALQQPYVMFCTDGAIQEKDGHYYGHPRGAGSTGKLLGKYVREDKVISLMEALNKLTIMPAEKLGWKRRGRLTPGAFADVVVFDPETIANRAKFGVDVNAVPPTGIDFVLVNGKIAVDHGKMVNEKAGRAIRRP